MGPQATDGAPLQRAADRMLPDAERLPTIDASRVFLRELAAADAPALLAIFGDPEVCRFWSRPPLEDLRAAQALQAEVREYFDARTLFQWGLVERETGTVVGSCTLAALSVAHRRAELGFALARPAWGRGYMAEMLPALLSFAFGTLRLHCLEADVDPLNARSIRALERLGFVREGYLRERYLLYGQTQDALLYGLLHREWDGAPRA